MGDNRGEDAATSVARCGEARATVTRAGPRVLGGRPDALAGSISVTAARKRGVRVLPAETLHRMNEPMLALRGSNLGDAIGTGWFLRDVDGSAPSGRAGP